jgi:hypothetical protein
MRWWFLLSLAMPWMIRQGIEARARSTLMGAQTLERNLMRQFPGAATRFAANCPTPRFLCSSWSSRRPAAYPRPNPELSVMGHDTPHSLPGGAATLRTSLLFLEYSDNMLIRGTLPSFIGLLLWGAFFHG